jgi:hypothetical protein
LQQHLLRLVRILAKENILFKKKCDPTIPKICLAKNPTVKNIVSCFYHHWRGHLMSWTSNWYFLKIRSSLLTSSSTGSFVLIICSNTSKLQFRSKILWSLEFVFDFTKRCSWQHLTNIEYKDFLSYSSIRATPCSLPINEDYVWRLLYLGSSIKKIISWVFFLS